jgi:hypothetical protein
VVNIRDGFNETVDIIVRFEATPNLSNTSGCRLEVEVRTANCEITGDDSGISQVVTILGIVQIVGPGD